MEQEIRKMSENEAVMMRRRIIACRTVSSVAIIIIATVLCVISLQDSSPEHRVLAIVGAKSIVYDWQMDHIEKGLPADETSSHWAVKVVSQMGLYYPGQIVAIDLRFSHNPLDRNLVDAMSQLQSLRMVAVDCTRATEADRHYLISRANGRFEVLGSCDEGPGERPEKDRVRRRKPEEGSE